MILLLTALAMAGESDEALAAEHVRLSETMRSLASRNIWDGVDRSYRELESLRIALTHDDHYLGAQAAWAQGDAGSTRIRLERALAQEADAEVKQWLAEIHTSYSTVSLSGSLLLEIDEVPLAADQRAALAFAEKTLVADGGFAGMLPNGRYTFGDHAFELFPGCPAVNIGRFRSRREWSIGRLTPTASVGLGLSRVGTASASEIQPVGFTGLGMRLGLGPEISLGSALGLKAEVGYQNLLSIGSQLHLGYGWLAATGQLGDWRLLGGPTYGVGAGTTTGLDLDTYQAFCAENPDDSRCGWVDEAAFGDVSVSGRVAVGGLGLGASRDGLSVGTLQGELGLLGGVMTDTLRAYPWIQLTLMLRSGE